MLIIVLLAIGAYLIGSIPVGFLVARAKGIDILHFGSGNIGATNVHRALGGGLGLLVFVLDVMKGALPALIGQMATGSQIVAFWIGIAAVVGHCLSPFLRFKGGKGIATGLGAVLGSCPQVAGCAFAIFLVCLAVTRFVSVSSIVASLCIVPLGIYFKVDPAVVWPLGVLAAFVIARHAPNIKRLRAGTEPKFSLKRSRTAKDEATDPSTRNNVHPPQAASPEPMPAPSTPAGKGIQR